MGSLGTALKRFSRIYGCCYMGLGRVKSRRLKEVCSVPKPHVHHPTQTSHRTDHPKISDISWPRQAATGFSSRFKDAEGLLPPISCASWAAWHVSVLVSTRAYSPLNSRKSCDWNRKSECSATRFVLFVWALRVFARQGINRGCSFGHEVSR